MINKGDTVRVISNGRLAIVKATNVSMDHEVEDADRIVRMPNGDTLVLMQWKKNGGPHYAEGPRRYMVVPSNLLVPQT